PGCASWKPHPPCDGSHGRGQRYREEVDLLGSLLNAEGEAAFDAASRHSFLLDLSAIFTGRERILLPLEDVVRAARMDGQVD
ncbi:hypothetical protein, partial [Salmonella sp. SAL04281]|uniref:hypothetical protein n=1 Tax=Salmonella sp. SAL04281 TaxID=3159859 RepID=UPI00397E7EEA